MARILIVDDEKNIRLSLRRVLTNAGHETKEAENGKKADELLANNAFDLVITDIIMPVKDGTELIKDIN